MSEKYFEIVGGRPVLMSDDPAPGRVAMALDHPLVAQFLDPDPRLSWDEQAGEWAFDLDKARGLLRAAVDARYEAAISPVSDAYPLTERETWHAQMREALLLSADPQAEDVVMLPILAAARGIPVYDAPDCMVSRVLSKEAAFRALMATALARRLTLDVAIDAATDAEALDAVEADIADGWPAPPPAD